MHFHSLLWLGAATAAAAFLYRRLLDGAWIGGLAALLVAVDDAHAMPAVWLANRNALIGLFFGLLALIAHDRWRRDRWWPGAIVAPLAFGIGLLSKESTLSIGAYLFAYALFVDRRKWLARFGALIPCAAIGIAWWFVYREFGYGATGSEWYVDPGADPLRFARAAIERLPNLLAWLWFVPSDLGWKLSPQTAHTLWLAVIGMLAFAALMAIPLLRRDRLSRFCALGMLLSLLPACSAYPSDRLLLFASLGAMGLIARFVTLLFQKTAPRGAPVFWRVPARLLAAILVVVHLIMAPWTLAGVSQSFEDLGDSVDRANASLPSDRKARLQTFLLASTPSFATLSYCYLSRLVQEEQILNRAMIVGSGGNRIELRRIDKRTLLVRPDGGFLAAPGGLAPGKEMKQLLFDQRQGLFAIDRLYSDATPMEVGQKIDVLGMTVEIAEITEDGRPASAVFGFRASLDNPLFRWLHWKDGRFAPLDLPEPGEATILPAPTLLPDGS